MPGQDQYKFTEAQLMHWKRLLNFLNHYPSTQEGQARAVRQFACDLAAKSGLTIHAEGQRLISFATEADKQQSLDYFRQSGTWMEDWLIYPVFEALGFNLNITLAEHQTNQPLDKLARHLGVSVNSDADLTYNIVDSSPANPTANIVNANAVHWAMLDESGQQRPNPGAGDCGAYTILQAVQKILPAIQSMLFVDSAQSKDTASTNASAASVEPIQVTPIAEEYKAVCDSSDTDKKSITSAAKVGLADYSTEHLISTYSQAMSNTDDIWLANYSQNAGNEILANALLGLERNPGEDSQLRDLLIHGLATEAWRDPKAANQFIENQMYAAPVSVGANTNAVFAERAKAGQVGRGAPEPKALAVK